MPYKRRYPTRKAPFTRKRRYNRKVRKQQSRYRGTVARIPRPILMKPKSVAQKFVYFNSFHCRPDLNTAGGQRNFNLKLQLNNPWMFPYDWNNLSQGNGAYISPNEPITPLGTDGHPAHNTTCMPGLKDGYSLFNQFEHGCVVGTKVIISAQPTENDGQSPTQSGVLYAVRSSKNDIGMNVSTDITQIQSLPFRQMKRLAGPSADVDVTNGFTNRNTGAKIVVNHSPKKWNNLQSLRDNADMQFTQNVTSHPDGLSPPEGDFLHIGVVPSLTDYIKDGGVTEARCVTNFKLSLRIEMTCIFSEPLSNITEGTGNYSIPWDARMYGGIGYTMSKLAGLR